MRISIRSRGFILQVYLFKWISCKQHVRLHMLSQRVWCMLIRFFHNLLDLLFVIPKECPWKMLLSMSFRHVHWIRWHLLKMQTKLFEMYLRYWLFWVSVARIQSTGMRMPGWKALPIRRLLFRMPNFNSLRSIRELLSTVVWL